MRAKYEIQVPIPSKRSRSGMRGEDMIDLLYGKTRSAMKKAHDAGQEIDPRSLSIVRIGSEEFGESYYINFEATGGDV